MPSPQVRHRSTRLLAWLLCSAVFFGSSSTLISDSQKPQPKPATLTYQEMKEILQGAIDAKAVELKEPMIQEGKKVAYYNFDVYIPEYPREMTKTAFLFQFPVRSQYVLESIQLQPFFAQNQGVWRPAIVACEKLIAEQVAMINQCNETDTEDMHIVVKKLHDTNRQITSQLESAVSKTAKNKVAVRKFDQTVTYASYLVNFKLMPDNGQLYYLTVWEHRILARIGKDKDYTAWHDALAGRAKMIGQFYFHAKWPDGRTHDTGIVPVFKDQDLVFSPR
jgi:hypothetical protein